MSAKAADIGRCALVLAVALAGGCSAFHANAGGSDSQGPALAGDVSSVPTAAAPAAEPSKREPFWAKWRDERVEEINRNLNVHEPPSW